MNTHFASHDLATHTSSHAGVFDRISGFFASLSRTIADLPRRRLVMDELSMLSEHELADIGLTRGDIGHVFDADFMAQRDAERAAARVRADRRING